MTMLLLFICAVLGIVIGGLISLLLWKTGACEEVIEDDFFRPNGFISYVFGCWQDPLNKENEKEKK